MTLRTLMKGVGERAEAIVGMRAMSGVAGAALMSQAAALLVAPLLTRLYPASSYGQFSTLLAFANIASTVILLGLNDAILAARDQMVAARLLGVAVRLGAILLAPLAIFAALAITEGWSGMDSLPLSAILVIVPLVACLVLSSLLQAALVFERRFRPLASSYLAMGWARAAAQVAGGMAGLGYAGLAVGEAIGRFLSAAVMARGAGGLVQGALASERREAFAALSAYRAFPLRRMPSALVSAFAVSSPVLMINALHGAAAAGQFGLTVTILMGPVAIVQRAIGDVFTGEFGALYRSDRHAAGALAARFVIALVALSLIVATLLGLFAPVIFATFFGTGWTTAGLMAAACAPWIAVLIPTMVLSQILIVTHRPEFKLAFDLTYAAGLAGLYFWARDHDEGPLAFVSTFAWLSAAVYLLLVPLIYAALKSPGQPSR